MSLSGRFALALISFAALGCNRYEYARSECLPGPPSHSAIAWRQTPGTPGTISVIVASIDSLRPITDARVQLRPDSGGAVLPFGTAPYVRTAVPPGHYTLDVVRIGYSRVTQGISIGRDSAVEAVAIMTPHRLVLDGCGSLMQRVKKPWWQWW